MTTARKPRADAAPPAPRRPAASAKSEQRIRDILHTAKAVFAERGYARATTTEMAQRLGISEATIFTYFHSKRELCTRVIGDWYDDIIRTLEDGMPLDTGAQAQLAFLVRTHLRLFLDQGTGLCALVLSEGRSQPQELGLDLHALQRRYTRPLMNLLRLGQERGEVRTDVPLRVLRAFVFGPMEHMLWETLHRSTPPPLEEVTEAMMAVLWPAIAAPDAELLALRQLRQNLQAALTQVPQNPSASSEETAPQPPRRP